MPRRLYTASSASAWSTQEGARGGTASFGAGWEERRSRSWGWHCCTPFLPSAFAPISGWLLAVFLQARLRQLLREQRQAVYAGAEDWRSTGRAWSGADQPTQHRPVRPPKAWYASGSGSYAAGEVRGMGAGEARGTEASGGWRPRLWHEQEAASGPWRQLVTRVHAAGEAAAGSPVSETWDGAWCSTGTPRQARWEVGAAPMPPAMQPSPGGPGTPARRPSTGGHGEGPWRPSVGRWSYAAGQPGGYGYEAGRASTGDYGHEARRPSAGAHGYGDGDAQLRDAWGSRNWSSWEPREQHRAVHTDAGGAPNPGALLLALIKGPGAGSYSVPGAGRHAADEAAAGLGRGASTGTTGLGSRLSEARAFQRCDGTPGAGTPGRRGSNSVVSQVTEAAGTSSAHIGSDRSRQAAGEAVDGTEGAADIERNRARTVQPPTTRPIGVEFDDRGSDTAPHHVEAADPFTPAESAGITMFAGDQVGGAGRKSLTGPMSIVRMDGGEDTPSGDEDGDEDGCPGQGDMMLQDTEALARLPSFGAWEFPLTRIAKQDRVLRLTMKDQACTQALFEQSQQMLFRRMEEAKNLRGERDMYARRAAEWELKAKLLQAMLEERGEELKRWEEVTAADTSPQITKAGCYDQSVFRATPDSPTHAASGSL